MGLETVSRMRKALDRVLKKWVLPSGSAMNEELLFQKYVVGEDYSATAGSDELGEGSQSMENQEYCLFHGAVSVCNGTATGPIAPLSVKGEG